MLIVLSPAKSLDYDTPATTDLHTTPAFVPRSAEAATLNLGSDSNRENTLLVGESQDYALTEGMIGFVQRGHNIRFQVNLHAAQHAGLKLSGRLASLAEIVQPRSP